MAEAASASGGDRSTRRLAEVVRLPGRPRRTVSLLDVVIDCVDSDQAADLVMERIRDRVGGWVCTINVAILVSSHQAADLRRYVDEASIVVADGAPLVWFSKLKRRPLPERVAGIDLVVEVLRRCERERRRVYFLGSTDEVIEAFARWSKASFPSLIVAGQANGYFDDDGARARVSGIVDSAPDLLLVGMGVPRQERFILDHVDELDGVLSIGVGGSFEVLAGKRRRAPGWMQRCGLEWLFRLVQEPRRLWRRYLVTNSRFVALAARDLFRR